MYENRIIIRLYVMIVLCSKRKDDYTLKIKLEAILVISRNVKDFDLRQFYNVIWSKDHINRK